MNGAPLRDPVRALHVYSGNLYGGVETFLRTLARHPHRPSMATDFALCSAGKLSVGSRDAGRCSIFVDADSALGLTLTLTSCMLLAAALVTTRRTANAQI